MSPNQDQNSEQFAEEYSKSRKMTQKEADEILRKCGLLWPDWIKVGQRIRETSSTRCAATITEITQRGFKHEYDEIKSVIPRMGLAFSGGEVYMDVVLEMGATLGWEPIYDNFEI